MDRFLDLIVLGIVQGITEFLPISSDGHLVVAQKMLGLELDSSVAVEVALHLGTWLAVLLYFRRDLARIAGGIVTADPVRRGSTWRLVFALGVACVPAGVVGVLFKHQIEETFKSLWITGGGFLFTALTRWATKRFHSGRRELEDITIPTAFWIGCAQVLALGPGISRSGTTIASAMMLGVAGSAAGRFSFLLSLPVVGGAILLESKDIAGLESQELHAVFLGIAISFVTGLAALKILTLVIARGRIHAFSWYLIPLGLTTCAYALVS